jgi:putative transcriptional regulator
MIEPGTGILLIADPFLKDPNFLRTVVFLCEHRAEGSFGFVLNRRFENTLDQLLPDLDDHPLPVYYGGPVQPDTIHFLHQYPEQVPGGQEVLNGVYWGGDFEALIQLIRYEDYDPEKIRFFIGYSGWGEGQLAQEMEEKSWLTVEATQPLVFHSKHDEVLKDALLHLGGDYSMMVNFPIDPQLN